MSRYAAYGSLDDRIDQAGDVGFVGFNNRLRPDQLQPGMLADAQNIRLDSNGQAQVRKGVDLVVNPLSVSLSALTVPFSLNGEYVNAGSFIVGREYSIDRYQASDNLVAVTDFRAVGATYANEKAVTSPTATANTLTITVTGHGRSAGTLVLLASTTTSQTGFTAGSSGTKIDGSRLIASVPDENTLTFTITGITDGETISTNNPAIYDSSFYPFIATGAGSGSGKTLCSTLTATASASANILTITLTGQTDGYVLFPNSGTLKLSDVTTISPDPNGDRGFAQRGGATSEIFDIVDQDYSGSDDTTTSVQFGILADNVVNNIYGSIDFSSPNAGNGSYILVSSNTKSVGFNLDTKVTFDIGYPSAVVYSSNVDMIQAFNKVFLFKGGETPLENNLRVSTITSIVRVSSTSELLTTTSTNHNLETGDIVSVSNVPYVGTDLPNNRGLTITKVSDTTFTYLDLGGGSESSYPVTSSTTVATDFTKVKSGAYAQPTPIDLTNINYSQGIGLATASSSGVSTLRVGDELTFVLDSISTANEQTLSIFVTSLAGGCNMSTFRTTRTSSDSGTPIALTLGLNEFTMPSVDFERTAFFRFTNSAVEFNSLTHNGTQLYSSSTSTTIAASGLFQDLTGTFTARIGVTPTGASGFSGTSTYPLGATIIVSSIPSATTFTFPTDKSNFVGLNGVVRRSSSQGLGFVRMPAPKFATYHQRRLFMPYDFSVESAANTYKNRRILDEVIASDILDTDTYDQFESHYRFNAGTSDFVVGLHSFAEDKLLVFNRNSIHIIANTTDLKTASTQVLTDEVGCVARKSIKQVGNQVIFLSDNGVYGTQFLDEYNLRGTETPLSEPINATIGRINKNAQENSVAVYFDNRYYIAVPLDGSTNNNAILIYNFLNKQWESIDEVNDDNYHISNLLLLGDRDNRGVYTVNDIGGVHRLDHRVDGVDRVITQIGGADQSIQIPGALTTRQYTFGTLDRKRWKEFDFHIQSSDTNTSDLNIDFETENPDDTGNLGTLTDFNDGVLAVGEDVSIRGRIGNRRGYGIQFTFNNTVGRPIIRAIEVEGATTMRSTNKAI